MHRICSCAVLTFVATTSFALCRDLTFEQRLDAQRAIERVNHAHQVGSVRSFDMAVPQSLLERKVRTYLKQSAALARYWRTPVTAVMLSRELERIQRSSQMPSRLRELYAALGNDPFLIQECIARPILVDRLARRFYAFDATIHELARLRAETLRDAVMRGELDPREIHPARSMVEIISESAPNHEASQEEASATVQRLAVLPEELRVWRARIGTASRVVPIEEDAYGYHVRVPLAALDDRVQLASYFVPKRTWDDWWSGVEHGLDEASVAPVAIRRADLLTVPCLPDDTWDLSGISDSPDGRYVHTAVWTGTEMIVWGGFRGNFLNSGSRYDPATDTWRAVLSTNAPSARGRHTRDLDRNHDGGLGGLGRPDGIDTAVSTGGRYDPATDTWTATSTTGAPTPRLNHTAVWTGQRMIVWGGEAEGAIAGPGARYRIETDSWEPMATQGGARTNHTAVWTGTEMIVWGGAVEGVQLNTGARYNPASNTWTPTQSWMFLGAPQERTSHVAVWTGTHMLIWGGYYYGSSSVYLDNGGRYDPTIDAWLPTSTINAPSGRFSHEAVWTGSRMIVWGGRGAGQVDTGGQYDPVGDVWTPTTVQGAPGPAQEHTAVWTGSQMIVWGGSGGGMDRGGRYNPTTDSWTPTSTGQAPVTGSRPRSIWTGNELILWGGTDPTSNIGARYNPTSGSWATMSTTGVPTARVDHSVVWTGDEMIVWGGSPFVSTGGRYDPISDEWTATSTIGAPTPRSYHSAVWTGDSMIVWGGSGYDTGARYRPSTDDWTPISSVNAPAGRYYHSTIWTGDEMIVWGGLTPSGHLNSGGRYNPASNTWVATSLINAPAIRYFHTAVWTGHEMIVWGGASGDLGYALVSVNTGGRYDPATDNWTTSSTDSAPLGRQLHTAVWSGNHMLVWGGYCASSSCYYDSGGIYDPVSNAWQSMASGSPSPRTGHTAVWTGSVMLVWGGERSTYTYRSGGAYARGHSVDDDLDEWTECDGDCNDADATVHPTGAEVCDARDNDCDGAIDNLAPLVELPWLLLGKTGGGAELAWSAIPDSMAYDVVRGNLQVLRSSRGDFQAATESCQADNLGGSPALDPQVPATGGGYVYLVRTVRCAHAVGTYDSNGTHQQGDRDAEIDASANSCP